MGFKIGVCGVNSFGQHFVQLFKAHPLVDEVILADLDSKLLGEVAQKFGIEKTVASLDELCKTDVDAIAIYTQRWKHAPQAIQALRAGKHVYSAVPAAITLEELDELIRTVKETGLTYMLGETSYYRAQTIYCRNRFVKGDFGKFVYGEGQYYHDMSHYFYPPFYRSNGDEWKKYASFPPMLYPTHSVSHVLGVTFSRMTETSCFGFKDNHIDGLFRKEISSWNNDFSNESALFRTADGGMARINEFRRSGAGESRMSIIGTEAAYEEQAGSVSFDLINQKNKAGEGVNEFPTKGVWRQFRKLAENPKDGVFDYTLHYQESVGEDLIDLHDHFNGVLITEENLGNLPKEYIGRKHRDVSRYHPVERLPKEFVGLPNGHAGSHQFLIVDFMEALQTGKLPPNNVWIAARYNAPGIVAHESAMRGGELLKIPDFGKPQANWELMDPMTALND